MSMKSFGDARANVRWSIREEAERRGYKMADIARMAKVSETLVHYTLYGYRHSPAVLDALRSIGVPEKYLHDPRKEVAA